jgi:hypothetical protein
MGLVQCLYDARMFYDTALFDQDVSIVEYFKRAALLFQNKLEYQLQLKYLKKCSLNLMNLLSYTLMSHRKSPERLINNLNAPRSLERTASSIAFSAHETPLTAPGGRSACGFTCGSRTRGRRQDVERLQRSHRHSTEVERTERLKRWRHHSTEVERWVGWRCRRTKGCKLRVHGRRNSKLSRFCRCVHGAPSFVSFFDFVEQCATAAVVLRGPVR